MVGADLANLANEAALLAARRNHDHVQMADFTDSLEKIMLGAPRGILLSASDRERTAYHESGHALVGMLTPGADPVRKISIIPRGMALGVTLSTPDTDRVSYSLEELEAKIRVALGGRVAEEVVYGQITTGAESDIQQLTAIARQMVGRWGMSEAIGPIAVLPERVAGVFLPGASETSAATQQLVDEEVRRLVDDAHRAVTELLNQHRDQLDSLTHALLEAETLDMVDAYSAASLPARRRGPGDPGGCAVNTLDSRRHATRRPADPDERRRAAARGPARRPLGRPPARRVPRGRDRGRRGGETGELTFFPDRTWHGYTYVPVTAPASNGNLLYGYVRFVAGTDGREQGDFTAHADITEETIDENPDWHLDLCDEVIGTWNGADGEAAMTLVWGRALVSGGAIATAELGEHTVDECGLIATASHCLPPTITPAALLEVRLYADAGEELARESLYDDQPS